MLILFSVDKFSTTGYEYVHKVFGDYFGSMYGYDVNFKFAVKTHANALVLLSNTTHPKRNDPVYEIVIGGSTDYVTSSYTSIRRRMRGPDLASTPTLGILNSSTFVCFWLNIWTIMKEKYISLGISGSQTPIFEYYDDQLINNISYYAFSSDDNFIAHWRAPCGCS